MCLIGYIGMVVELPLALMSDGDTLRLVGYCIVTSMASQSIWAVHRGEVRWSYLEDEWAPYFWRHVLRGALAGGGILLLTFLVAAVAMV